jgi:eukaryotic-like serine/threonine-protein kinase
MALTFGTKLGPYEIVSPLGAGGMGEVYRARDTRLGREVAIKILPQYLAQDLSRAQRFEHEARVLGALNHPNLLAIYDVGAQDEIHFLVSELLDGATLRQRLNEGPLQGRKAIEYGVQIAKGLAAAHDKGVVHRDLKPENLFLTKDGRVKILDFGLAKVALTKTETDTSSPTMTSATGPGVIMGTVGYMSPEQVRGAAADHRSDIFAFGAVLYEMLTGKRAFHKATSAETMTAIMKEDPPVSSQTGQNVSPALYRVLQRCLEKNPEQRFQSASDLAFALEAMSDSGSAATGAVVAPRSRVQWIWVAAAGVGIAIVAGLTAWGLRPSADPVLESVVQLTNDGQVKTRLETDGTRLYFNEGPLGSLSIAQVAADGGETARLPTRVPSPLILGISAEGSSLLITPSNELDSSLWLLPVPAGEARRLGDIAATDAALFPDGRVVYSLGSMVYIAAKDGSNPHKLATIAPYSIVRPQVSPDAKWIVVSTVKENLQSGPIYEMGADGTGLHQLLTGGTGGLPAEICCPEWTSDGKYLVFRGWSGGKWNLWTLRQRNDLLHRTVAPAQLSNGPISYHAVAMGRDARKIFAVGAQTRGELVRYDLKSQQFVPYLGGISAFWTTFSNDGKWVTYISYPEHTLWRSRSDGSDRLQLTYSPTEVTFAHVSPDGSKVAFNTADSTAFVVSMNGGTPTKIAETVFGPNWSPDGNLLAFVSPVPGKHFGEKRSEQVGIADLRDGKVRVVPGSEGINGAWFVTQDTVIGLADDLAKVLLLNITNQKTSELAVIPGTLPSWVVSPDRKYFYCSSGGSEPKALRIRLADHAVETIASLKNLRMVNDPYVGPQVMVAPDGSVLVTREIGTEEIYALTAKWP